MSDLRSTLGNTNSIVLSRQHGGRFKLCSDVLERLAEFVQDQPASTEAGGVLLGRRILDSDDIVIDDISVPHEEDARSRFSFKRSLRAHQEKIDRAWSETNGTANYLGEWHTHPEARPSPSCVDIWDWRRLVRKCRYDGDELFFVIVGTERTHVWEVDRETRTVQPLLPFTNEPEVES